jgi:hypothetical protein
VRVTFTSSFSGVTSASATDAGFISSLQNAIAATLSVQPTSIIIEKVALGRIRIRALTPDPVLAITFRVEAAAAALSGLQTTFSTAVSAGTLGAALTARGLTPSSTISVVTVATVTPAAPSAVVLTVGAIIGRRRTCAALRVQFAASRTNHRGPSSCAHAGIAIASVAVVIIFAIVAYCCCCRKKATSPAFAVPEDPKKQAPPVSVLQRLPHASSAVHHSRCAFAATVESDRRLRNF